MGTKRKIRNRKHAGRNRRRPEGGRRWSSVQVFEGPAPGPNVVSASLDEVLAAMESVPDGLDWPALADQVVPVLQRVRPYPPGMPEPIRLVVPPGLSIGFGVDIGPAFLNVHADLLESWPVTTDELLARALDNLERRMAAVEPDEVLDGSIGGVQVRLLQSSTGSASAFVLLPGPLGRILGPEPQLLMAPMRNLLVSIPPGEDRGFASWLFDEFAAQDPNCLAPAAFLVGDGRLEIETLGEPFGSA